MKDWNVMLKASAEKCRLATEYDGQNVWANDDECVMIYHPLWNREAVKAVMPKQYSSWKMFNTFKLLRSDLTEDEEYAVQAKPQNGSSLLNRIKKTTAKPVDKPVIDDAGVVQVVGERVFFRCIADTCNQLWDRDIVIIHAVFGADEAQNTKNGRGNDDTSGASKKCIAGTFHCCIAFLAFYHKSYGAEKCYYQ